MSDADLVAEEARRFAARTGLELEEAEQLLKSYGLAYDALEEEGYYE